MIRWLSRPRNFVCVVLVAVVGLMLSFDRSRKQSVIDTERKGADESIASLHDPSLATRLAPPPVPPNDYVGSGACTPCHSEIARHYQSHPMSKSLATVQASGKLEDYLERNSFEAPQGMHYAVEQRGDRVFHHERLTDGQGQTIYDDSVEVHFALGSGTRGRSYLIGKSDVLRMSPIGWYTPEGWDLSPGYNPGKHQRFDRRITDGCLQCHSGRPNFERDAPNRFPDPAFHEEAIGCERCHGPGAEHIAFRRRPESTNVDPIVNPKDLALEEREAVCNQCHLQAEERIPRYGRSDFDFRPGQRITDIWTVFMRTPQSHPDGSIAAVTQVQQMRSSRCYQQGEGRMGCTSCHDPHRTVDRNSKDSFYRDMCLKCHTDESCAESLAVRLQSRSDDSCIACHMPALTADIVPHTSQTDHRILRKPAKGIGGARLANQLITFDDGGVIPEAEQSRARGLMLIRQAESRQMVPLAIQAEGALTKSLGEIANDPEVFEALGACCLIQQRPQEAVEMWSKALKLAPHRESVHWRLGTLYHDLGKFEGANIHLQEVLRLNPGLAQAHARLAHIRGHLGQMELGIESAERALKLDPMLLPVYGWLAEAYDRRGNESGRRNTQELYDRLRNAMERTHANHR